MQSLSLLTLRTSLGGLLVYWGIDKLVNVSHGVGVAQKFYGGLSVAPAWMQLFGVLQALLGVAVIAGVWRRVTYPALLLVTGTTLLAVWQSIVDPFKVVLPGGNLIFYPSLIIVAASLVLIAFKDSDTHALDAQRARGGRAQRTS